MTGAPAPIGVRLMRFIAVDDPFICWPWMGTLNNQGYGVIGGPGRRNLLSHRAMYVERVGPIPDGFEVDHRCGTPRCVNPLHLEAVPPAVNNLRSRSRSAVNARKTHCIHGHEFTDANTRVVPTPTGFGRQCRECARIHDRRRGGRRGVAQKQGSAQ